MANLPEFQKRARKAEADGELHEAATLYERAGDIDKAIALYQRSGGIDRAAALLEATGRAAHAAALLSSVGQYLKAAAVYEKMRDFPKAAAAYLRADQRERAAAIYEKAEAFEDAAKVYASLGNYRKAIQLFTAAGNSAKAHELAAAHGDTAEELAAAEVLELDPEMEIIAGQYLDSKEVIDSVVAYLRHARTEEAAHLYGNCQEDIGYSVIAAVAGDPAAERKAAEMFMFAKDYQKAAQVFENLEDYPASAAMYERAEDAYMAGEMYVRAGNKAKAAEMFERHGDHQHAAELFLGAGNFEKAALNFEKSVNHFVAGKLYFRLNKMNKSLQLLQKVQKSEREYFEASRLIGEILAANGYLDLAIRKYLEVVQAAELSNDTGVVYYNLAKSLEQRGNHAEALNLYNRIAAWQFTYADVAERVKALSSAPPPPQAPAAPQAAELPTIPSTPEEAPAARPAGRQGGQLVSMMDGFDFLKGSALFRDLSLDEMKAVYNTCETRAYKPGETLIEQDQPGTALFVLRKGNARVLRISPEQEEMVARLGPGSPAGEMALIDDAPTSARVVAETEVEAFVITRERFEKLLALSDKTALKLYRFFIQTLAKRLRATSENLAKMTQRSRA